MADGISHGLAVARSAKGEVDHIGAIVRGPANASNHIGEIPAPSSSRTRMGMIFASCATPVMPRPSLATAIVPSHMGSMAVGVFSDGITINEVVARSNASLEFEVVVVDAGIDHGDGHTLARCSGPFALVAQASGAPIMSRFQRSPPRGA